MNAECRMQNEEWSGCGCAIYWPLPGNGVVFSLLDNLPIVQQCAGGEEGREMMSAECRMGNAGGLGVWSEYG